MKAWLLDSLSGLSALRIADVPDPAAAPGEVVLQLKFAALNPADRYLAEKQYPLRPPMPHILGRDGVGRVAAIGEGVHGVKLGEIRAILRGDVGGTRAGTFAGTVAVPEQDLVDVPQGWTLEQGAGATLVYLTAHQALTMWGPTGQNAVVLVTGASGGVGVASVQLAKAMGHTVIALSRNAEKGKRLRGLGADIVHNPEDPDWRKQLKSELGTRRVDLAVDNVGGTLFPQVVETLGDLGKISVVGRLAGPVPEFNTATLFFRRLRIGGVAVGAVSKDQSRSAWREIVELLNKSRQSPIVDSVFPFAELLPAFDRLAKGPMGKVLLDCTYPM